MKQYKVLIIGVISLFALNACNDWLDINSNPNYPSELESPEAVIPTAELAIANAIMGWDMGFAGAYWCQYWTQNYTASQFKFLDEYKETDFQYAYDNLVSTALMDLKSVKDNTEKGDGWYLISEVLSIYSWQVITDTWGDIPYSEALQGASGLFTPKFDTQKSIYTDLMTRIDDILATDYSEAYINGAEYDFIAEGDMEVWIQFANTLKLKLMIRLSETSEYDNTKTLAFIEAGTIPDAEKFLQDNAMLPGTVWEDANSKQHPMVEYEVDANYLSGNVIGSRTMISYLDVNKDPRLDVLYDAPSDGIQQGAFQGDFQSDEDSDGDGTKDEKEEYSTVSFEKDADIPLISLWEQNFYIAEVYARASDFVNAAKYYNAAVIKSLEYWGLEDTITNAGEYAEFTATTTEAAIEQIAMQKWVAYCKLQHIETLFERNRTKYPKINTINIEKDRTAANINFPTGNFTISVQGRPADGSLVFPSSPTYSDDVTSANPNSKQKSDVFENVWWNQKAENFVE